MKYTVLDFYAPWCAPCRAFKPTFEKWAAKYKEVEFILVDITEQPELAASASVSALPTVVVMKDDHEVARFVGAPKESQLLKALES